MNDPPYTVRVSRRAQRMHLVVSASDGLTVVIPPRFDRTRIAPLVAARLDWIERARHRVEAEREHLAASRAAGPPGQVLLNGIGEAWRVSYRPSQAVGVQARPSGHGDLTVSGSVHDVELVGAALRRFVARRALEGLGGELRTLAAARGIDVGPLSVRGQRTRWASCSAHGAVSLNRNLAFLPPRLVRHVLLHELCHRRVMSHSPAFWQLLDAEEPDRRALDAELRTAWRFIPHWARS
ncbi:MAG TPA: YgjP-like metallopeptidase domain-containing protein [Acidimicrobiales bacterium]|nr:YgjP-like metallopeptidase domain-containing protein [Acidimicrobiales bacterium]